MAGFLARNNRAAREISCMANDDNPHNVTAGQSQSPVMSEPVDQFDRRLGEWFAAHGGVWSGTASELFAAVRTGVEVSDDLWPGSRAVLYAHIESHQQVLDSLGVSVSFSHGHPRMISIRSSRQGEPPETKLPSGPSITDEISSRGTSTTQSNAEGDNSEGAGDNTAETLIALLKTSPAPESTKLSTISKLAAAPAHLRTAFKRVWIKRPRAM
jgi:hypothetical protein